MSQDPSPLLVRPLAPGDLPAALAIQSEAYPGALIEYAAVFASRIEAAGSYCLAAERDGRLVGYLLAHGWTAGSPPPLGAVIAADTPGEVLYVHDLAVSPAGRGAGADKRSDRAPVAGGDARRESGAVQRGEARVDVAERGVDHEQRAAGTQVARCVGADPVDPSSVAWLDRPAT